MEGLKLAFAEIFEQDFDRARIQRSAESATNETRDRLLATITPLALSPGYHTFAYHLMGLESQTGAGVPLDPKTMPHYEAAGLICLASARAAFKGKHPSCGSCGAMQPNRFMPKCDACGVDFRRKNK